MGTWCIGGHEPTGAMSDLNELTDDPCHAHRTPTEGRSLAFVLLFVAMFGGFVFAMFSSSIYETPLTSALGYTAGVMTYGFSKNKGDNPPYLFTCPVVVSQYPRLLKRHAVFLAILIAFVAIALRIKPHLSEGMARSRRSDTFFFVVAIPVAALALTEILTNRGVLERAHRDHFGEPPAQNNPKNDAP